MERTLKMDDRTGRVRLIVEGIELEGPHGVYAEERIEGNRFRVDVEILADLSSAVASDQLEDTIDYASVAQCVTEIGRQRRYNLIESFAGAISDELIARFPRIEELVVRLCKLSPPGLGTNACAAAEIRRKRQ
jgi:dihydroneopterin aldolase